MRYFELLVEKETKEITSSDTKQELSQEMWDILDKSYAALGGFKSYDSPEHMVHTPGTWVVSYDDNNTLTSGIIFKNQFGNKLVGLGTNGQPESKQDITHILNTMKSKRDFWAEVSGPLEKMFNRMDLPKISNKYAEKLTGKAILELDEDGYHYVRFIAGQPIRKIIMGYPEI